MCSSINIALLLTVFYPRANQSPPVQFYFTFFKSLNCARTKNRMVKSKISDPKNDEIAIVGIGCKYPGNVNNPEQFWDFQFLRKDGFCNIPSDRWDVERFNDPDSTLSGVSQPKQCAFLASDQLF